MTVVDDVDPAGAWLQGIMEADEDAGGVGVIGVFTSSMTATTSEEMSSSPSVRMIRARGRRAAEPSVGVGAVFVMAADRGVV